MPSLSYDNLQYMKFAEQKELQYRISVELLAS